MYLIPFMDVLIPRAQDLCPDTYLITCNYLNYFKN